MKATLVASPPRPASLPPDDPTLATAGARTCRVGEVVELGPKADGDARLAFDRTSGLAVWKPSRTSLALQPIAFDGTKLGRAGTVAVADGANPTSVRARDDGFVVILRKDQASWRIVADRSGRAHGQPAPMFTHSADVPDVRRDRSDAITFGVTNAAVPLPPSGGTIYEPAGRPVFERMKDDQAVGQPLSLEWNGNPISYGMNVKDYIVWSGTHFLYPFSEGEGPSRDQYVQLLLPIDCRP